MFDIETTIYRNQQRAQERERQAKRSADMSQQIKASNRYTPADQGITMRTEVNDYIKGAI